DLQLGKEGRVTVAVFFATWCPHCQMELPRVVAFARMAQKHEELAGKVRVLGIRTAIEKEVEPYEEFERRMGLNFQVYTDPVMALAFSKFAKAHGLGGGIPVVAVVDRRGYTRFNLINGDYRNTARDLL